MKNILTVIIAVSFLAGAGCSGTKNLSPQAAQPNYININGKMFATLYMQRAAEFRALCFQAVNAATQQVLHYKAPDGRPLAIITDVDETVLDNSPYAVYRGSQGKDYESVSWYKWTDKASADTLPGVGSFLRFVHSRGIEVFYVTNREEREFSSTLTNLSRLGLPDANGAHLFVKKNTSSKDARRLDVTRTHNVVLFMGDNLADFSGIFEKKNPEERMLAVNSNAGEFGSRFIIFPNSTYGDWESSLYGYKYNYTIAQKDSIIKAALSGY